MGQKQSASAAAELAAHRAALYERQCAYRDNAETTQSKCREQLRLGNREGAANLARQLNTIKSQEKTIAGIISNLDAQAASLETKELTQQTMAVMSQCVRQLGKHSLQVQHVEATMEQNDDVAMRLKEITDALTLPIGPDISTDDLVLEAFLADETNAATHAVAANNTAFDDNHSNADVAHEQQQTVNNHLFFEWARKELRGAAQSNGKFPPVPSHSPGNPAIQPQRAHCSANMLM